jgi:hypothetical protein
MEKADKEQEKEKLEYEKLSSEEQQRLEAEWNTEKADFDRPVLKASNDERLGLVCVLLGDFTVAQSTL